MKNNDADKQPSKCNSRERNVHACANHEQWSKPYLVICFQNAGKSTLLYRLSHALRRDGIAHYALRASPDGEGDWSQQTPDLPVSELRMRAKGVSAHLHRLVGLIATSALISGAAGSLRSTAGLLLRLGVQQLLTPQGCALVVVKSKWDHCLWSDLPRDRWASRLAVRSLTPRNRAIYAAWGFATLPALQ